MPPSVNDEIGIVAYRGVQLAAVYGLTDLFAIASKIALDQKRAGVLPLRVTHWQSTSHRHAALACVYDSAPRGTPPHPRFLIIPPTMIDLPDPEVPTELTSWLREQHAAGATLISVCSGAFLLAATGVVDGRSVSTHPICGEALGTRFPEIVVDTRRRIIDYGDIITAGGFIAWVDVALLLIERIFGAAEGAEIARIILSDPSGRDSRFFPSDLGPTIVHGDRAVLKAQEFVHMRDGRGVSLAAMAASAGLERRTFLRRFTHATGMTPIEYSRTVRMARARELLEAGNTPQKDIAQSLGYKDVASFARVFRRATGWAPGAYRKRFGLDGRSPPEFRPAAPQAGSGAEPARTSRATRRRAVETAAR